MADVGGMASARLGSARLGLARLGVISAAVVLAGCSAADPPSSPPGTGQRQEKFSSFGIERVIPLRIVMMANDCNSPQTEWNCTWRTPPSQSTCNGCTSGGSDCGPDTADLSEMRSSLEKANAAVKALGVQFFISRVERHKMPTFWNKRPNTSPPSNERTWSQVRDELRRVFPSLPLTAWDPNELNQEHNWLQAAAIRAGEPREVIVWVAECSSGWDGARPWAGAASLIADREQFLYPRGLAHEFGHIMGLEHTMYPAASADPERQYDGVNTNFWEYWDLYYGIGSQNTYFATRAEAAAYSADVFAKQKWDPGGQNQNCWLDSNCTLSCLFNGQLETIGTPGIAGLGFTFAGDNPGTGVYRRGANAMMYLNDPPGVQCPWSSFSHSQAEQVKKILRSDVRIDAAAFFAPYSAGYTAKRNLIGDYRNRSGFDQLDFDGDGKRDIAVWQPPGTPGAPTPGVGRFRVLTSSSGYTTLLERDFGVLGDVPVPGYYDNDTKSDFAVLRRPNVTNPLDSGFRWLWCKSAQNHDCVASGQMDFGHTFDVPLPNVEFDGNSNTREVAMYRPTNRTLLWRVVGDTTSGTINVAFSHRVVHMHGLFDADNKTDVVLYDPGTPPASGPRFQMRLSTQNWGTAHIRNFSSALMADAIAASGAGSSAPAVRHGGVAVPAESNGRSVLRVWDAYTGHFHTMWDPIGAPTTISSCQWGEPRDIPLGGPIDRNADVRTDFVAVRPFGNPGGPAVFIRESLCGTMSHVSPSTLTAKTRVWAVTDMNGDGKGDFLLLDPETHVWTRWISSGSTWVFGGSHQLGDLGAVPL